jgi:ribosomal protein L11 methylase PrmA
LLLSGLLQEDEPDILKAAIKIRLKHVNTVRRDKWISLKLIP